jgi:catechol 2,3-dioxygenase-like lactoylglutathione lyase family enzyme
LVVDSVAAEYSRLRDADIGVEFRSPGPNVVPDTDEEFAGYEYMYVRTPDGATFELTNRAPSST